MKYSVLIVEDVYPAQNLLKRFISERPELEFKQLVETNNELIEALNNNEFDLMLLDITLHEQSALDVINEIDNLPYIIFTTSNVNFAYDAFSLGAIDYLLKPFEKERFDKAINKFITIRKNCKPCDMYRAIKKIEGDTKYKCSPLTEEKMNEIAENLIEYMESTKVYTNPKISLKSISNELNISINYLSQVINQKLEKNFYEFINQYRADEVKRILTDPENDDMNILDISYATGFNSKSVFNKVFKEFEGTTPSKYRKKLRGE